MASVTGLEPADLGDLALHLDAGQMATGAGLGALAELEVERLDTAVVLGAHLVDVDQPKRPEASS